MAAVSEKRAAKLVRRALKREKKRRAANAQKILDSLRDLIEASEAEGLPRVLYDETGIGIEIDAQFLAAYQAGDTGLLRRLIRERFRVAFRKEAEAAAAILPRLKDLADVLGNTIVFSLARKLGISVEETVERMVAAGYMK